MNIPYARSKIIREAFEWERTPYHHLADVKGVGVDCAMYPIMVYRNAVGMLTEFDPRPYAPEWHLHRDEERFIEGLIACGARRVEQPEPGDLAMFKYGRTASHGSIVVTPGTDMLFLHSYMGVGVIRSHLSELDYADRLHSYWSLLA